MDFRKLLPKSVGGKSNNYWNSLFGSYEKDVVNFYEKHKPYRVSVDVGAGVGYHTKKLAEISDKVVAIEPIKEPKLPENVDFYNLAVGPNNGKRKMKIEGTHIDGSEGAEAKLSKGGDVEVEVVELDSIVSSADFLKMDIEGYEDKVLRNCKLIDNVDYAVIETHGGLDMSILEDFRVKELEKSERVGKFLFCKRSG